MILPLQILCLLRTEAALALLILGILIAFSFSDQGAHKKIPWFSLTIACLVLVLMIHLSGAGQYAYAFTRTYVQDSLSFIFKTLLILSALLTVWLGRKNDLLSGNKGALFCALTLISLLGMCLLISSFDFLVFFLSLELTGLSLYLMTAYLKENPLSVEAGLKYLVLGAVSSAFFLLGLSFIFSCTQSTSFWQLQDKIRALGSDPLLLTGIGLVICSIAFKIAAFPFQFWAPDVYEGSPLPVTAFLATASKIASVGVFCRLFTSAFYPLPATLVPVVIALSACSMVYGNLCAIGQKNLKRLLAYTSIASAGYLLIGFVAFDSLSKQAIVYYLLTWFAAVNCFFLVLSRTCCDGKSEDVSIQGLAGLAKKDPLSGACLSIALISLAGVPPLAGFFGKFIILLAAFKAHLLWLAALGAVNILLAMFYLFRIVRIIYADEGPQRPASPKIPWSERLILTAHVLAIFLLGIYQAPFLRLAQETFSKIAS